MHVFCIVSLDSIGHFCKLGVPLSSIRTRCFLHLAQQTEIRRLRMQNH